MYKCSVHDRVMVLRELPFRHWHCPVEGCTHAKPDKHGPRVDKRDLDRRLGQ